MSDFDRLNCYGYRVYRELVEYIDEHDVPICENRRLFEAAIIRAFTS